MNKYRDKSDFEINKAVAVCSGKAVQTEECQVWDHAGFAEVVLSDGSGKDYCNNPADAMPIIIENKISLHAPRFSEGWMAEYTGSDDDVNDGLQADYFDSHNQNPLRAAMEVFLMMKNG